MTNIRKEILDMAMKTKDFHIASSFSCIDILTVLYDKILTKYDKFILSKGHACLSLYAVLIRKGLKPDIYKQHPDIDVNNGIECTTGSLGHGLPIAIGMALAKKIKREPGNIYIVMSDGEFQEGTTWESLLIASHHKLNNLIIILDNNQMQSLGKINDILSLGNIKKIIQSFNIDYFEIDGHDARIIRDVFLCKSNMPIFINAHTIKGKGISFIENKPEWHARLLTEEEYKIACVELLENG